MEYIGIGIMLIGSMILALKIVRLQKRLAQLENDNQALLNLTNRQMTVMDALYKDASWTK